MALWNSAKLSAFICSASAVLDWIRLLELSLPNVNPKPLSQWDIHRSSLFSLAVHFNEVYAPMTISCFDSMFKPETANNSLFELGSGNPPLLWAWHVLLPFTFGVSSFTRKKVTSKLSEYLRMYNPGSATKHCLNPTYQTQRINQNTQRTVAISHNRWSCSRVRMLCMRSANLMTRTRTSWAALVRTLHAEELCLNQMTCSKIQQWPCADLGLILMLEMSRRRLGRPATCWTCKNTCGTCAVSPAFVTPSTKDATTGPKAICRWEQVLRSLGKKAK